jgi:hypothetical protein
MGRLDIRIASFKNCASAGACRHRWHLSDTPASWNLCLTGSAPQYRTDQSVSDGLRAHELSGGIVVVDNPANHYAETHCKSAKPLWIPSFIWSDTVGRSTAAVSPRPQLRLRTPNAPGSALTGMAAPTATLSATAALSNTFVITRCRTVDRGTRFQIVGRGTRGASTAPCGGPPAGLATRATGR